MNPKLLLILGAVPVLYTVSVSPDGLGVSKPANSSGQSYEFVVLGLNSGQGYTREILCTGQVTNCSSTTPSSFVPGGYGMNIIVTFSTLAPGTGRVRLKVYGGSPFSSDSGWINVTVSPPYAVAVTPDNGSAPIRVANSGGYSEQFTITNTGLSSNSYSFQCTGANGVTCGTVPPPTGQINANASVTVNMPYSVGNPGTGTLTLRANGSGGSTDVGSYSVPIVRYGVTVATYLGVTITPTRFELTGPHSESFVVTNTGSGSNTFSFSCSSTGPVSCGTPPGSVSLNASANATVSMPYTVGAAGSGTLTLTASGTNATGFASYGVPVAVNLSKVSGGVLTLDSRYLLQETANSYDLGGRVTQLKEPGGSIIEYRYGPGAAPNDPYLTQIKRWKNSTGSVYLATDISYLNGDVSSIRDPAGATRAFEYDGFGRLIRIKNNGLQVIREFSYAYSRTSQNGWIFQAAAPNTVIETNYMQGGATPATVLSAQYIDGLGRTIQSHVRDGANYHITATQYDLMGRPWRAWRPYTRGGSGYDPSFDQNATLFYNNYHGTTAARPFTETRYRPDGLQRVRKVYGAYIGSMPADSVVTNYGIEANALVTETVDESQKKRSVYADAFNYAVATILGPGSPEAATTSFINNILGQRIQVSDPRQLVTSYSINTRGLQVQRSTPDAGTVKTSYDAAGNPRYIQDAVQATLGRVQFLLYDSLNRSVASGEAAADFASLNPLAPPEPFETTRTNWLTARRYDAMPPDSLPWNLFQAPPPLLNVTGRLAGVASRSNGAWQVTYFSYDPDGEVAARYTYTQANGGGPPPAQLSTTVTYTRDLRGSITQRVATVGSNSFYQWYEYDARGLLSKVFAATTPSKPLTPDLTDTYSASGHPDSYQFQNGPIVPLRYTIRGQTAQIGDPAQACPPCPFPFSARYAYRPNGAIDTAEFYNAGAPDPAPKRFRYVVGPTGYDPLNRIKKADFFIWNGGSWSPSLAFGIAGILYDKSGNLERLQRYDGTANPMDDLFYRISPSSNRLDRVDDAVMNTPEPGDAETATFTYDANGNLKTATAPYAITDIIYDAQNLPLTINQSGAISNYRYDEAGQRIAKQLPSGSSTDYYLREGASVIAVVTLNGTNPAPTYFNILWENRIVGRQVIGAGGIRTYYHVDMLASTRAVVLSTTGAVVESYDFDPWGFRMPGRSLIPLNPTKEGFTGKERDVETMLDYFGARYYMSALGRWSGVDPLAANAPAWSPYAYTNDNPMSLVDPTGRQACFPVPGGVTCTGQAAQELWRWIQYQWAHRNDPTPLQRRPECGSAGHILKCLQVGTEPIPDLLLHLEKEVLATAVTGEAANLVGTKFFSWLTQRAAKLKMARVRALGQEGELAWGGVKNTKHIPSTTGTAAYRVPDGLTAITLTEVKHQARLGLTNQIRDFAAYAQAEGLAFELWVRPQTILEPALLNFIAEHGIILRTLNIVQ